MGSRGGYSVVISGNHGQEPDIDYDTSRKFWTVDLRPHGPGKNCFFIDDSVIVRILNKRLELVSNGTLDNVT